SSTRARSFEAGVVTLFLRRPAALRMRVSISPRGSLMDMISVSLPAGLHEAGHQAQRSEFAKRDTRHVELAVVAARTPRHRAAIADARLGGVARHLRQLQLCGEALFHRL